MFITFCVAKVKHFSHKIKEHRVNFIPNAIIYEKILSKRYMLFAYLL